MPPFMSLPVSPTGSPHLHSRSPHHVSGRMSPASISSPLTMSGSSTPLSGGNGAIPFHLKYSSIQNESYGGIRSPTGLYLNSSTVGTYHYLKPDLFLGAQECPSVLREKTATKNSIHGKAFSRPTYGENQLQYGGQVALSEHVSHLLRNSANTYLSPDVRPSSPMLVNHVSLLNLKSG